ncbi:MAG TPA: ornithine cyclodeaminase family protein [Dongiaceae bacterium]|nr:ornithine cyclodeaminase family protein [Dongiaceae bacterium]
MTRDLLYLSRADVEAAGVTMPEIIDRLAIMFREKGHGRTEMPPKPDLHPGPPGSDNFIHAMPAYCGALGAAGLKWIAGFPGNRALGLPYVNGLIVLNDVETGMPLAVMDATWITAMRTGAASAIAARHLARADSALLAITGCGVQARTNLEALAAVLPRLRTVRAYDIHPERASAYAEEMGRRFPHLEVQAAAGPRAAIEGADVIVTAAPIRRRPEPVIEAAWFREGALGLPLDYDSSWTPAAMATADRFYTDDTAQLLATRERGDFFQQIPPVFADLGDVVAGLKEGRRAPGERLLCLNMGIALDDMATAPLVLERARERGLGTRLTL